MATHDSMNSSMTILNTDPLATFQIIEKIGEGNNTAVYKALNKITDKLVAIKVFPFHPDYPYDSEIQFIKKLDHPFIDKLIDIYRVGQQVWMISDYCQLGSIADIIRMTGEPLSEAEISCICYNVLYALDYVHSLGRSHGSVKANNILVNSLGQIKLTDFGNALWMGPQDDDYSGDMWALGLCLIEMVEGNTLACQRPGQRQPSFRTQQIVKTSNAPEYSAELKDLISQCLQVDPKRRPKASKLFDHPFICKHKRELPQIRKRLYQNKMEKISEFKRSLTTSRAKSQPPQVQVQEIQDTVIEKSTGGEENVPDDSYMTSNTVFEIAQRLNNENTIEYTLESDNYLASAVKPSFNLTEDPSHIELSNRNPIFTNVYPPRALNPQDSISHIKIVHQDDSNEQSFNITARSEQLSIISQSSRLCFTAAKKGARVPPLNINSTAKTPQGRAQSVQKHYKSENIYGKENQEDLGASIVPFKSVQTHHKLAKPKMYKATNESNFIVKHRISLTSMNTHLNCSVDTESTLNPISADRQRLTHRIQGHGANTTRQLIEGLENFTVNIPRTSFKDLKDQTISTATTGSKGSSGRKSIFQTPKPGECKQSKQNTILKVVKENLDHGRRVYTEEAPSCVDFLEKTRKPRVEIERAKLEMQMKKELEEIKKKYNTMFRGLGKSVGGK